MKQAWRFAALLVVAAGSVIFAGGAGQSPQVSQRPTFRTQIEYVEVDVLVNDKTGHFVPGLKKDDFQVREDGKVQSIANFSVMNVPMDRVTQPLFTSRPIEPDVKTNERPFEGRVYVLLFDDLHVDASRTQMAKNAARTFIERNLAANDLMAIVNVGGREEATQEFTNNKRLLLDAVDKFMGRKLESATITRNDEYFAQLAVENRQTLGRDAIVRDPMEALRLFNARASFTTIRDVSEWFGGVRGRRKTLLYISEGIDYDTTQVVPAGVSIRTQFEAVNQGGPALTEEMLEAIGAAQRANVSLYSIDPRGLTNSADESIGISSFAQQIESQQPTNVMNQSSSTIGATSMRDELVRAQNNLRDLAEETGGTAVVSKNDFAAAFDRIVSDSTSYYVLAYYPPSEKRDGKFHKIDVRVSRPGVIVRARHGYMAPRGAAPAPELPGGTRTMSPELRDALSSPLPVSGLTIHAFATPFRGTGPNASVLVGVDAVGRGLNLSDKNSLELSYMALNGERKMAAGNSDRLNMNNLKPETKTRVQQTGLRILNRMELPPGRYQMRVASHDSMGGAVGSVIWDLDIPDFDKAPLTMSGIVITSVTTSAWASGNIDEQMRKVLPAQPVALREFPQDDEMAIFAEIYDNKPSISHKVDVIGTVLSNEGRVLFKTQEERTSEEFGGATRGAYGYMARIPLKDMPPGTYTLGVRARSSLNDGEVERQVQFQVTAKGQAR